MLNFNSEVQQATPRDRLHRRLRVDNIPIRSKSRDWGSALQSVSAGIFSLGFLLFQACDAIGQELPLPVIDMHLHARDASNPPMKICLPVAVHGVDDPQCSEPLLSPDTNESLMHDTIAILERRNIIGVISGYPLERVHRFLKSAPHRMIPAYQLNLGHDEYLSPEEFRQHVENRDFKVLGEIENQYAGIAPNDERMNPYWEVAEKLDIPVALHLGEGYPGVSYDGSQTYRIRLGSPLLLEEVLIRYPKLRIYVMHYGSPLVDEMIAILFSFPQVYVDIGGNTWAYPKEFFYGQLRKFIDAGFEKRIMFGSDQMRWPDLIEKSIEIIINAPFLNQEQKRNILYNNAARFLKLSDEEIAQHHGR